jgi:hypothetical protein
LVAVDPSREGHEQHLQGVEICRHGPILPGLTPERLWVRLGRIFGHYGLVLLTERKHPERRDLLSGREPKG